MIKKKSMKSILKTVKKMAKISESAADVNARIAAVKDYYLSSTPLAFKPPKKHKKR